MVMAQKFYILEVEGDVHRFVEVDGEMVDLGFGEIKAFVRNAADPGDVFERWTVYDLATGATMSRCMGTRIEAVNYAKKQLGRNIGEYAERVAVGKDRFGLSPAVEE